MKSFIFALLIFTNFICAGRAQAHGAFVTGGGHAIKEGSSAYALADLAEAGNLTVVDLKPSPLYENALQSLTLLDDDERSILASRIDLLSGYDMFLATAVMKGILAYSWVLSDLALTQVIPNQPVLSAKYEQLAIRKTAGVYIYRPIWSKLARGHQAALIFHEVVSALESPLSPQLWARQFTSTIFNAKSSDDLKSVARTLIDQSWTTLAKSSLPPSAVQNTPDFTATFTFSLNKALSPYCPTAACNTISDASTNDAPGLSNSWDLVFAPSTQITLVGLPAYQANLSVANAKSLTSGLCDTSAPGVLRQDALQHVLYLGYRLEVLPLESANEEPFLNVVFQQTILGDVGTSDSGPLCSAANRTELSWMANLFTSLNYLPLQ